MEDLDTARTVPGAQESILDDLRWMGIDWEVGPDSDPSYVQSARTDLYDNAIARLGARNKLFPCALSRKDLQALASAPLPGNAVPPFPAHLRPRIIPVDWKVRNARGEASLRFRVTSSPVTIEDRVYGSVTERVSDTVGDFVVKRRDGVYAYHLAVVVDDLLMGITNVVRGQDLLASTARQVLLIRELGGAVPQYAHVPLMVKQNGTKLSKRHQSLAVKSLRASGVQPEALVGYLAYSAGLLPSPKRVAPSDLVPSFRWKSVRREAWVVPDEGILSVLRKV